MKSVTLENQFTHERFICDDMRSVQVIDGVEYLSVYRPSNPRVVLIRKDALKRIPQDRKSVV